MDGKRQLRAHSSDGPLKEHNYLDMLQSWFLPQVETLDMNDDAYFQQNGLPARYALAVREYLSEVSRERWFGRLSPALSAPLGCSPRRPDLSLSDISL
jgi:hypothetical protein